MTTLLPDDRIVDRRPAADGNEVVVFWFDAYDSRRYGFRCTCAAQSSGWRLEDEAIRFADVHRCRWHGGAPEAAT